MESELMIFVGLPASGKSTYYRSRFAATHVHVSNDLMPNARNRPDVAIYVTAKKLVPPAFEEGFDEVRVIAPLATMEHRQ